MMAKDLWYDSSFREKDDNHQLLDFYKSETFDSLGSNKKIICSTWSQLFQEALVKIGVNPENIHIRNRVSAGSDYGHKWVEVDISDIIPDHVLIADPTDALFGFANDLERAKFGVPVEGFMLVPKKYSGMRISTSFKAKSDYVRNNFLDVINNSDDYNKRIDRIMLSDEKMIIDDLEDTSEIPIISSKENKLEDTAEIPIISEENDEFEDTLDLSEIVDKVNTLF